MAKYLTRFGIAVIQRRIAVLEEKLQQALQGAGEAAQRDTNAYHDNFEYEEGMRQQEMLSQRLRALWDILEGATPAPEPADAGCAAVGHYVEVERGGSGEREAYVLCGDGEGAVFENACSVFSPLGRTLLGMAAGETRAIPLGNRSVSARLLSVRPATAEDYRESSHYGTGE